MMLYKPDELEQMIAKLRRNIDLNTLEAHSENRKLLKKSLADNNIDGYCLLHKVARNGLLDIVKLILKHYPDFRDQEDKCGQTVLIYAAQNGQTEVAEHLISLGAHLNLAAQFQDNIKKNTEFVWPRIKCLLKAGAPITKSLLENRWFRQYLYLAKDFDAVRSVANNPDLLTLLDDGSSMVHKYAGNNCLDALKITLQINPGLLDQPNKLNESALICAAAEGHKEAVKHLLLLGADLSLVTKNPIPYSNRISADGWTARDWAFAQGHQEIVDMLDKAASERLSPNTFNQGFFGQKSKKLPFDISEFEWRSVWTFDS